jgi:hypothetical protein
MDKPLIVRVLCQPDSIGSLDDADWDILIRQARRANLLGRLADRLASQGLMPAVPSAPARHLASASGMAQRQDQAIRWEVERIAEALDATDVPFILLKGAAYVMAEVPAARGRTFSDVDILVPKAEIPRVESALMLHGWQGGHHDAYDQRYYRQWMHEIPPMMHVRRGTTIDVHHTILPETARIRINTPALFDYPLALHGFRRACVLPPIDMLLHSATHLFHEGEFENGLRDLFDLDSMFRDFGQQPGFWQGLLPRASQLGLTRPLHYALRFCHELLATPVPVDILAATENEVPRYVDRLMGICYRRVLRPTHDSCHRPGTWLARQALYIRSHWIRMPFPLLARHLARKAFFRPSPEDADAATARPQA